MERLKMYCLIAGWRKTLIKTTLTLEAKMPTKSDEKLDKKQDTTKQKRVSCRRKESCYKAMTFLALHGSEVEKQKVKECLVKLNTFVDEPIVFFSVEKIIAEIRGAHIKNLI